MKRNKYEHRSLFCFLGCLGIFFIMESCAASLVKGVFISSYPKIEYSPSPPLYSGPYTEDQIPIRYISAEEISYLNDCEDANTKAVKKLTQFLMADDSLYQVQWFDFWEDEYIDYPICKKSKGSFLVGNFTKVKIRGLMVKKKTSSVEEVPPKTESGLLSEYQREAKAGECLYQVDLGIVQGIRKICEDGFSFGILYTAAKNTGGDLSFDTSENGLAVYYFAREFTWKKYFLELGGMIPIYASKRAPSGNPLIVPLPYLGAGYKWDLENYRLVLGVHYISPYFGVGYKLN